MLNWMNVFQSVNANNQETILEAFNAVKMGDIEKLANLLNQRLNPNARNNKGYTLLHMAVLATRPANEKHMLNLMTLLVNRGADVNAIYIEDQFGPLHSAVRKKLAHVVLFLLDHHADMYLQNDHRKSAFDYALEFNDERGLEIMHHLKNRLNIKF